MATEFDTYLTMKKHRKGLLPRILRWGSNDRDCFRQPANDLSRTFAVGQFPLIGGGLPYSAGQWTITTGGTGDAQAEAVTFGGGVLITAASDSDFDTTLDSVQAWTPTSADWVYFLARFQVSDATGIGFRLGVTTSGGVAPLPFGTDYTDQVTLDKPIASADVASRVRGNSGTAAAGSAALGTIVAATEVRAGFAFYLHATNPAGKFFYNGAVTEFTAAQRTALGTILTSPPTMYCTLHVTGVTGTNPTLTVAGLSAGVDR